LLSSERPDLPSAFEDLVPVCFPSRPVTGLQTPKAYYGCSMRFVTHRTSTRLSPQEKVKQSNSSPHSTIHTSRSHRNMKKKVELGKLSEAQAQKDMQKELKKAVTKTIAAFLNTSGGTLLIGVNDSGATIGIEADFPYLKPENSMLMAGFRRCRRLSSTRSVLRSGAPFTFR